MRTEPEENDRRRPAGADIFEPLLDSQQAAELMHVHPETVKRLARRWEIQGVKFGKVWRFRASGLKSFSRKLTD